MSDPIELEVAPREPSGGRPSFAEVEALQASEGRGLAEIATVEIDPRTGRVLALRTRWDRASTPATRRGGALGLVLPVLDCRPILERQLGALHALLDRVDEVVVVDGHSRDGSLEFLAANLPHPGLRAVRHPRGLYASWNAALALLSTEHVLIATAGDAMDRDGLAHLHGLARAHDADVVVSPPRLLDEHHVAFAQPDWPLHQILRRRGVTEPFVVEPAQAARWAFHFAGSERGILGSSASNLYRTRLLQEHPFPIDCGPAGDVAWGIRNFSTSRVVVTPRPCADFVYHPRRPLPVEQRVGVRLALLRHALAACGREGATLPWRSLRGLLEGEERSGEEWAAQRRSLGRASALWPPSWRRQLDRALYRRLLSSEPCPAPGDERFALFWRAFTRHPEPRDIP